MKRGSKSLVPLSQRTVDSALNALIFLFMGSMILGFLQTQSWIVLPGFIQRFALQILLALGLFFCFIKGWRPALSLNSRVGLYIIYALVAYFAGLKISDFIFSRYLGDAETSFQGWGAWDNLLLVALVAPLLEELFFRDVLFRSLQTRWPGFWRAASLSSIIFMLAHMSLYGGAFLLGFISTALFYWSRSLWPSVVFHSLSNLSWYFLPVLFPNLFSALFQLKLLKFFYQ